MPLGWDDCDCRCWCLVSRCRMVFHPLVSVALSGSQKCGSGLPCGECVYGLAGGREEWRRLLPRSVWTRKPLFTGWLGSLTLSPCIMSKRSWSWYSVTPRIPGEGRVVTQCVGEDPLLRRGSRAGVAPYLDLITHMVLHEPSPPLHPGVSLGVHISPPLRALQAQFVSGSA